MKIAVFSDIHDNLARWREAVKIIAEGNIEIGICLGDVTNLETLEEVSKTFEKLYFALGNGDWQIKNNQGSAPENVEVFEKSGEILLAGKKVGIAHDEKTAKKILEQNDLDIIFYGHSHTPWEKKLGDTVMLNPGEIAGHFGKASFAIFDLTTMSGKLILLK